jgi:hypothetical protein
MVIPFILQSGPSISVIEIIFISYPSFIALNIVFLIISIVILGNLKKKNNVDTYSYYKYFYFSSLITSIVFFILSALLVFRFIVLSD